MGQRDQEIIFIQRSLLITAYFCDEAKGVLRSALVDGNSYSIRSWGTGYVAY